MTNYNLWCIENCIQCPDSFIVDVNIVADKNPKFRELAEYLNKLDSEEYVLKNDIDNIEVFNSHMNMTYNALLTMLYEQIFIYDNIDNIDNIDYNKLNNLRYLIEYSYKIYKNNYEKFIRIIRECKENSIYSDKLKEIRNKTREVNTGVYIDVPVLPFELRGD